MGLLAHEHRAGRGVGLEPSGGVHRVTERGVLDPVAGPHRAHHDRTRLDADAHAEALDAPAAVDLTSEFLDLAHDSEPGPDRSLGIVFVRHGCAEECEDAVAGEVLDDAAERLDGSHHAGHSIGHDELQVLGVQALAQCGGPDEVSEQGGHHSSLFTDCTRRDGHGCHCAVPGGPIGTLQGLAGGGRPVPFALRSRVDRAQVLASPPAH